jgi:DNA-binding response OmpR family regulator
MTNILIVEDDPAILIGLEELFRTENYNVTTISDGKDGLSFALLECPQLVILDIYLPNISGLDVCRTLRQNNFTNPIIMLTA